MLRLRLTIPAACLALALSACGDDPSKKQEEVRPVRTVTVDPKPIDDDRQAVGEIKPRQESDLGFRVSGKLVSRTVDVGVSVKKGDLLARLDEQDYQNRLRSAEADLAAAEAVLTEAQARRGPLAPAPGDRHDDAGQLRWRGQEPALGRGQARFRQGALGLAKDQLRYAELHADFDGIVTAVGAEPGQVVNVGQMIVTLAQPDEKDAVFAIAEVGLPRPAGRRATRGRRHRCFPIPASSRTGWCARSRPVADPATRTYQVKVALKNPPEQMRFGASVVGRLKTATAPVVVLPGSALFDTGGKPAVWVYRAASASVDSAARRRSPATRPTASSSARGSPRATSSSPPASTACARGRRCGWPDGAEQ